MKKEIIILIILLFGFFLNITLAQEQEGECEAMIMSPQIIEDYISISQEILDSIEQQSADNKMGSNSSEINLNKSAKVNLSNGEVDSNGSNDFEAGVLDMANNIGKQVGDTIDNVYDTIESALPLIEGEMTDFFSNFKILSNSYQVVRDRKKILTFDKYITQKTSNIAIKGLNDQPLTEKEFSKISSLFQEIEVIEIKIQPNITKAETIGLVFMLHKFVKESFLKGTDTAHGESDLTDIQNYFSTDINKFSVGEVKSDFIDNIKQAYKGCAGLDMTFGEFWKKFSSGVNEIIDVGSGFDEAWNGVEESYSNLNCFLFDICDGGEKQSFDMELRKNEILEDNGYNSRGGGLDNGFGIGKAWQDVKDGLNFDPLQDKLFGNSEELVSSNKKPSAQPTIIQSKSRVDKIDQFRKSIESDFQGILNSQRVGLADTTTEEPRFLKMFPNLSMKVYGIINTIGPANSSQSNNSIVENLGQACENQASNAGGTCYSN